MFAMSLSNSSMSCSSFSCCSASIALSFSRKSADFWSLAFCALSLVSLIASLKVVISTSIPASSKDHISTKSLSHAAGGRVSRRLLSSVSMYSFLLITLLINLIKTLLIYLIHVYKIFQIFQRFFRCL